MYKSQFQEIGPYDWFCGPGSHFLLFYNKTQTFLIPSPDRFHFLKCLLPMCSEPDSGRGVFWACAWWSNHLVNPNVCCDWPRPFTRASQRVCMLMSRRIRDATEGDKKRCSINPSFESSRGIKKRFYHISFSLKLDACLDTSRVTVRCPNRNRGVYSLGLARFLRLDSLHLSHLHDRTVDITGLLRKETGRHAVIWMPLQGLCWLVCCRQGFSLLARDHGEKEEEESFELRNQDEHTLTGRVSYVDKTEAVSQNLGR